MSNRNMIRRLLAAALLPLGVAAVQASDALAVAEANVPVQGVVGGTEFPPVERAWMRGGDFVNVDNLRQVGRGLSKNQVRSLLGNPHFNEGIGGVARWDYVFNFRTGVDGYVTCQYQLNFNRESRRYLVDSIHWSGPECLQALGPAPHPVAAEAEVHTLSADALFRFDRSGVDDILPGGRAEVETLAARIREHGEAEITVVGHADRLGHPAYNLGLSERRAATVRQLLVDAGIAAGSITAFGRGAALPLSRCDMTLERTALIACLRPDRRVEIEVVRKR